MNIIAWHQKHGNVYYEAGTPEQTLAAYMRIFNEMEEIGDYEACPPEEGLHQKLYEQAKKGDRLSAMKFVKARSTQGYEYEEVKEAEAVTP